LGGNSVTIAGNGAGAGGAVIAGSAFFSLASAGTTAATGNNLDFQAGAEIDGPSISYIGGVGVDSVAFNGMTNNSRATFFLGAGTDPSPLGPTTTLASLFIDFGAGIDTFNNNAGAPAPRMTLRNLP